MTLGSTFRVHAQMGYTRVDSVCHITSWSSAGSARPPYLNVLRRRHEHLTRDQGLTLTHVRAQLEQIQDAFMR
jgi:hypothetical protein